MTDQARTTRFATSRSGHRIAYDVQGDGGRSIVLLCGILMNRGRWHDVGYVDRLSERYRVVTIDPLGHGESDKPHDVAAYTPAELVDHVACVMVAERIDTAVVWGYSRGGRMTAMFAEAHPERVELAIIGGSPVGVPPEFAAPTSQVEALRDGRWEQYWEAFPVPLPAPIMEYMTKTNDSKAIGAAMGAWARDGRSWDALAVPSIGYLGDGEVFLDIALRRSAEIGLPMAVLPTGGHAETFAALDDVLDATEPYIRR